MNSTGLYGQSSVDNSPLNPTELRQVLLQLMDCNTCEEQRDLYEQFIEKEKSLCEQRLEALRQSNATTVKELEIALEEKEMWKGLYNTIKKKPVSFGCWMGRIFSLGNYRCPK